MRPRSAWLRLTAGLTLAFLAATAIVLAAVYVIVEAQLSERSKGLVTADVTGLADLYAQRRLPALREAIETRLARNPATEAVYLLLDKGGERLAGNLATWPAGLSEDGAWTMFGAEPTGGLAGNFLGLGAMLPGGFKLAVGHSTADDRALLGRLLAIFIATGVVILLIGGVGAALLSRWLVRRIVTVNQVAGEVRDGNLAARVPGADRADEFGELAGHVNAMLERIERLVTGMREVSDRIAHELRTPLTRLRNQIGKLAGGATTPETSAALQTMTREVDSTVAIFDALLDIATTEAEAGDTSRLKTVELADVVAGVVDLYDAVAEDRGIALEAKVAEPAEVLGDRGLLVRMLANVVDNAIKFSPAGGRVVIGLARSGENALLSVTDSGPGVPADFRDRAFERFARGEDASAVPGHGLGLAIVRAIALRHGISIRLENAEPGLRVAFTCPVLKR